MKARLLNRLEMQRARSWKAASARGPLKARVHGSQRRVELLIDLVIGPIPFRQVRPGCNGSGQLVDVSGRVHRVPPETGSHAT